MSTEETIAIGAYVTFRRGKATLAGTILLIDPPGRRADRRSVTIKTTVRNWAGETQHGNVTVFYSAIIGLAEQPKTPEVAS